MEKAEVPTEITPKEARQRCSMSQKTAAKLLDISQSHLSEVENGKKGLSDSLRERMGPVYGVAPSSLVQPIPEIERQFVKIEESVVQWQREKEQIWDSRILSSANKPTVRHLVDLYVQVILQHTEAEAGLQQMAETTSPESQEAFLNRFITDRNNKGILLIGKLGYGKTTFLKNLILQSDTLFETKRLTPILLSLGKYANVAKLRSYALVQDLADYFLREGYKESHLRLRRFFDHLFQTGRALVLFDGLDEIHDALTRAQTLSYIQRCFEDTLRKAGNKVIVSGRPQVFTAADPHYTGFQKLYLHRWHPSQSYTACTRWNPEEADRLWTALITNDTLFALARWPLFFHLLTSLYSTYGFTHLSKPASLAKSLCECLESTWQYARLASPSGLSMTPSYILPEGYEWGRFFVLLMEKNVLDSHQYKEFFSLTEMQDTYDRFLAKSKHIDAVSEREKFQSIIRDQTRLGSIQIPPEGMDKYEFPDALIRDYYLALAFVDKPLEDQKVFIRRHLREPEWQQMLALTLQYLGQSPSPTTYEKGESLLEVLLSSDDELGLEHTAKVHFGRLLAMSAIATYPAGHEWIDKKIIKPFLDLYMNSHYEHEVSQAFKILGECNTSPTIRDYFNEQYAQIHSGKAEDTKWRVFGALTKIGERLEEVAEVIARSLGDLLEGIHGAENRRSLRRYCWAFRQVGRLLQAGNRLANGEAPIHGESRGRGEPQRAIMTKVQLGIMEIKQKAKARLEKEAREHQCDFHDFDILSNIVQSQDRLYYEGDLKLTLEDICGTINNYFLWFFTDYPYRLQLIQFLKVASHHSSRMDGNLCNDLIKKFKENREELIFSNEEAEEIDIIVGQFKHIIKEDKEPAEKKLQRLMQEIGMQESGEPDEQSVRKKHADSRQDQSKFLRLVRAICDLEVWCKKHNSDTPSLIDSNTRRNLIKSLLILLECEENIKEGTEDQEREQMRIFTRPADDYCEPFYDHIHNCVVELARALPLG